LNKINSLLTKREEKKGEGEGEKGYEI